MNRTYRAFFLLVSALFLSSIPGKGQITVEGANLGLFTPEELIYNVFLGSGIEITDVEYFGNDAAVGFFSNGNDDIRIGEGILMTSGQATFAQDPNNQPNTTQAWGQPTTDVDLDPIASGPLFDKAHYEITFVPSGDTIRFNYVFASEEYPEYACTDFNDVFGFFLRGPDPMGGDYGGKNIALVPDPIDPSGQTFTNVPVAINNINSNGFDPGNGCAFDYSVYYNSIAAGETPTYDAHLSVFTALAEVIPCETYTIKLIVSDVGDDLFDTGIFLEGKSFGGGVPQVQTLTVGQDGIIAEGCAEGSLVFSIPFPSQNPIDYTFSVVGEAEWGIDYAPFQTSFTISPPDTFAIIPISVFQDGLIEGVESLGIDIQLTPCRRDTFFFFIEDQQMVPPDLPEFVSNCAGPIQLDGTLDIALPEPDTFYSTG
ncbi:MAG: hypothetical protein HKN16_04415, partial [Saprospiraceae bacterium]|nr:hypothetical protein [Saprospiraceae bacterium]